MDVLNDIRYAVADAGLVLVDVAVEVDSCRGGWAANSRSSGKPNRLAFTDSQITDRVGEVGHGESAERQPAGFDRRGDHVRYLVHRIAHAVRGFGGLWTSPDVTDTVTVVYRPRRGVVMATYSQEFKDQIVALHHKGRSFIDLAKEFNLAPTSISNWVRAAEKRDAAAGRARDAGGESDQDKIRRLEKELARKEEELEILGKALAFFARRVDQ